MESNYFIIHGSFGSPFGNWFSWLYDFIICITNAGHINSESGFDTFEEIVNYL